jgi:TPR repeat protein
MRALIIMLALLVGTTTFALGQARLGTPGYDAYELGDYETALKHWLVEAEAGDADIQARIALMYLLGEGSEKNLQQAARWFGESAEQNFGKAQYQLGRLYASGIGVEQDDVKAFVMMSAAIENGSPRATTDLEIVVARLSADQKAVAEKKLAEWWQAHPLEVEKEVVEVDNRTAMQKFNDWLMSLMPEGMVSKPR